MDTNKITHILHLTIILSDGEDEGVIREIFKSERDDEASRLIREEKNK